MQQMLQEQQMQQIKKIGNAADVTDAAHADEEMLLMK